MYKYLSCLILVPLLTSCASKTVGTGDVTDVGVWQGKVMMTNEHTKDRKWAYVTWISDSPHQRMRIDVHAILDVPIATYIRNSDGAHLWLFTEAKYFHSKDAKKLFSQLVKFSFDPDLFFSFLSHPKKLGDSWDCDKSENLYNCVSSQRETKVSIDLADADRRTINVDKGVKGLRMRLSRSKVQVREKNFKHPSTPQFDTIEI